MSNKTKQTAIMDRHVLPSLHLRIKLFVLILACLVSLCSCGLVRYPHTKASSAESKEAPSQNVSKYKQQVNQSKERLPENTGISDDKSTAKSARTYQSSAICREGKAFLPALEALPRVAGHSAKVVNMQIVPGSDAASESLLLSVDSEGYVLLSRLSSSRTHLLAKLPTPSDIAAIDMGRLLAATVQGNEIRIYSLLTVESQQLTRMESHMTSLDFSPTDQALLMGGADGRVYRWNYCWPERGLLSRGHEREIERYIGHGSVVSVVRYHPFGRFFFSGDWRGSLRAWLNYDAESSEWHRDRSQIGQRFYTDRSTTLKIGRSDQERVANIELTPDGRYVVVALHSGIIELWQVRGMRKVASTQAHRGVVLSLAVSPRGTAIVSAGRDGRTSLWRVKQVQGALAGVPEFEISEVYTVNLSQVSSLAFLNENQVVVGDVGGRIQALEALRRSRGDADEE